MLTFPIQYVTSELTAAQYQTVLLRPIHIYTFKLHSYICQYDDLLLHSFSFLHSVPVDRLPLCHGNYIMIDISNQWLLQRCHRQNIKV